MKQTKGCGYVISLYFDDVNQFLFNPFSRIRLQKNEEFYKKRLTDTVLNQVRNFLIEIR